ncbi:MAG: hypothetical protein AAF823_09755 [Planctomycetota bacterium]
MKDGEKIAELIDALGTFRQDFVSSGYSTMAFLLLAVGWLITSKSARAFLSAHHWLAWTAVLLTGLNFVGYAWVSLKIQDTSQSIFDTLTKLEPDKEVYEHHLISLWGVWMFILFNLIASILIVASLLAIIRNPCIGNEEE